MCFQPSPFTLHQQGFPPSLTGISTIPSISRDFLIPLVRSSHTCPLLALCFCHVALCPQNVHVCKFLFPSPGAEGENTGKEIDPASYRLRQHSVTPNRQTHLQKSESVHSFEFQFCYVVSPLANLMPIEGGLVLVSTWTVNLRKNQSKKDRMKNKERFQCSK